MRRTESVAAVRIIITCDRCGNTGKIRKCLGCGDDICRGCGVFWDTDPWNQMGNGDYPDFVCNRCNDKSKDLAEEAKEANSAHDNRIDGLITEWKRRCKEQQ